MAANTARLSLEKPQGTDTADLVRFVGDNMQKIDDALLKRTGDQLSGDLSVPTGVALVFGGRFKIRYNDVQGCLEIEVI